MKPTGATKDETLEQAQALTRDWNEKTRVEQIIVRHRVWTISNLPDNEYTASHADVKELINERERLRAAIQKFVDAYSDGKEARLGNGQARRSLDEFRQLLSDAAGMRG